MPKPQRSAHHPGYPALSDVTCGRRQFLGKLAVGAVALGVGSRLLAACTSTSGIDGRPNPGTLHTVRLPGEGFASAYIGFDDYLRYFVSFTTYNEAFAEYFRSSDSEGLVVLSGVLNESTCEEIESSPGTIQRALLAALESHYFETFVDDGAGIHELTFHVEECETAMIAGDIEEPGYP
ncbi:MAG: twin-arginine translocation signal domain-containing protein [Deltaproteobacteria bacterium]|nr:twin-arginine translocation signal domain-containing protein [Deltaproteobacteria bacterium]